MSEEKQGKLDKKQERAERLFKQIDADGDGFITPEELKAAIMKSNPKATNDNVERAMKMYDKDENGKISLAEYKRVPMVEPMD